MQTLDLTFIDKATGPNLVEGLERLARTFMLDLSELKRNAGMSESTFSRWINQKRIPMRSSRVKINICIKNMIHQN